MPLGALEHAVPLRKRVETNALFGAAPVPPFGGPAGPCVIRLVDIPLIARIPGCVRFPDFFGFPLRISSEKEHARSFVRAG